MDNVIIETFTDNEKALHWDLSDGEIKTLITFNKGDSDKSLDFTATLKKDSKLFVYNIITTSNNAVINETIDILDEHSEVEVINLFLGDNDSNITSNILINHHVKNTESNLAIYAIAKDNSKMIINNNAWIKNGSHKAIVHQKAKGLTLSKTSSIKAQPNLYIDEYDVIASHACAIGSINKDDLFYLMSRGLSEVESSKLIVMGFVSPILDHIKNQELNKEIKDKFIERL